MLISDIRSFFIKNEMAVDFIDLSLRQNSDDLTKIEYTGKGYISQSTDGIINYKLFTTNVRNNDYLSDLIKQQRIKSGSLYKPDNFYSLEAIDIHGNVWKANNIIPNISWSQYDNKAIIYGSLESISFERENFTFIDIKTYVLTLEYYDNRPFQAIDNEINIKINDYLLYVKKIESGFSIKVSSENPIPSFLEIRIAEAVRFVLADTISPILKYINGVYHFYSRTRHTHELKMGLPISKKNSEIWTLFSCYLKYILKNVDYKHWHPCSNHIHTAHVASANSLDAYSIGLSVAAEGLAQLVEIIYDTEEQKVIDAKKLHNDELKTHVISMLEKDEKYKSSSKRIDSMLGGLNTVRAIDKMYWLQKLNKVNKPHITAWVSMRNSSVHPNVVVYQPLTQNDLQVKINNINNVIVLIYNIIFHLIDYEGIYINYSLPDYKQDKYPAPAQ